MVEAKDRHNLDQLDSEQIQKLSGDYDEDGFYILEEGGFYDPDGFYFDRNGVDANGGFYDNNGIYIYPKKTGGQFTYMPSFEMNEDNRSIVLEKLSPEEVKKLEGEFDQDGFYILKEGGYYDPLGYYFDKDGFDGVGGTYSKEGYYIQPEQDEAYYGDDIEDYTLDDEDLGEEQQLADDDIQRQADLHEHIMPA